MKAIASQLETIISSDQICVWEDIDSNRQDQILQAVGTPASCIVYPQTQAQLAEIVACAQHHNWRILPCGSGSKLGWGGLAAGVEVVVSTERLNQVIEHAVGDLTVTVEAGTNFAKLQQTLVQQRQFLALDPLFPESATIGGIVATADTGSWRQRYGGIRDQLLGISFVRADGQIAKAGGRVVKNVAGYDLMKLFAGSYGTLGIITQVTFRVYPLPEASITAVLTGSAGAIAQTLTTLRASALTPTAADLLSNQLVTHLGIGEGLGLIVRFQSMTESVKEQSTRLLAVGQNLGLQSVLYGADDEDKWQKLREPMETATSLPVVTCKMGVRPSQAVATITQMGMGLIHTGSGLGWLRLDNATVPNILLMRSLCQAQGGFLSILASPVALKQQLDVWNYTGNALDIMRRIKHEFDPKNILSPARFVGGI